MKHICIIQKLIELTLFTLLKIRYLFFLNTSWYLQTMSKYFLQSHLLIVRLWLVEFEEWVLGARFSYNLIHFFPGGLFKNTSTEIPRPTNISYNKVISINILFTSSSRISRPTLLNSWIHINFHYQPTLHYRYKNHFLSIREIILQVFLLASRLILSVAPFSIAEVLPVTWHFYRFSLKFRTRPKMIVKFHRILFYSWLLPLFLRNTFWTILSFPSRLEHKNSLSTWYTNMKTRVTYINLLNYWKQYDGQY